MRRALSTIVGTAALTGCWAYDAFLQNCPTAVEVTTLAGNGSRGYADGTGGPNGTAEFNLGPLSGVAVDAQGNVYVADTANNRIRKIDPSGNVTTLAGNGVQGYADGTGGASGTAEFSGPAGVAVDAQGYVYVADLGDNRIRKIDPSGNVTTLAGNGTGGYADGTGGANGTSEFNYPSGVAVDAQGNVYVADGNNNRIRKVDTSGNVTTLAGNGKCDTQKTAGCCADGTGGPVGTAKFWEPRGVAVDTRGNVYVADDGDQCIRKVDPAGNVTTLAGGLVNGQEEIWTPRGVAVDAHDNVCVADTDAHRIRKIDPSGSVTTLAGNGTYGYVDGTNGPNGSAEFREVTGVAVDAQGNVYVADWGNDRIRKITQ